MVRVYETMSSSSFLSYNIVVFACLSVFLFPSIALECCFTIRSLNVSFCFSQIAIREWWGSRVRITSSYLLNEILTSGKNWHMITGFFTASHNRTHFFVCTSLLIALVFLHYRFLSFDERLVCHCGSSRCRGVVNDVEAEERVKKRYVPRSELRDWKGE